jgi:hypothetical protein
MAVPALKEITLTTPLSVEKKVGSSETYTYNRLRVTSASCIDYRVVNNALTYDPSITFEAAIYASAGDAPIIRLRGDILVKDNDIRLSSWAFGDKNFDAIELQSAGQELAQTWARQLMNLITDGLATVGIVVGSSA